jgi:2-oxo-4-hydroxy-4-carboxy-5-ureidoimidazoline decarboxylase
MVRATTRRFTLDGASDAAFREAIGPLFEGAPRFLARLAAARPFGSGTAMFARAREIARSMPEAEQVELIDAHPRLGAPPRTVSTFSFREQGYDAADPAPAQPDTASELARLNDAYERRFGFRYGVFVAGRPRAALIPAMEAALEADRSTELARALDAIVDIAADRWEKER